MTPIQTGWQPDGALGAMYHGMNAANAEDENEENLARLFLANQREQQMLPLDVQGKQYDLTGKQYESQLAQAKMNDPGYINSLLTGTMGQMQSQEAAGSLAKGLLPFRQKAEQGALENQATGNDVLSQFNQIDSLLRQGGDIDQQTGQLFKFSPAQQQAAIQRKESLMNSMMNTAKFNQDKSLLDDKQTAAMEALQTRMQGDQERARITAEAKAAAVQDKVLNDKQLMALQLQKLFTGTPEEKAVAQAILSRMQADAIGRNAALSAPQIDLNALGGGQIPMQTAPAEKARQEAEAAAQATQPSVTISSEEEWNKLPKGTKYTLPDGRKGIK
jgi:hypothetical protein